MCWHFETFSERSTTVLSKAMGVYIHIYVHASIYICLCVYLYVQRHERCEHAVVETHLLFICVYTFIWVYEHVNMHTYMPMRIYTYIKCNKYAFVHFFISNVIHPCRWVLFPLKR